MALSHLIAAAKQLLPPPPPKFGLLGPDSRAPQKEGAKDWEFERLGLSEPDELERMLKRGTQLNQGSTSSCVTHAWATAVEVEHQEMGLPPMLPSRLFGYSNARAEHGMQKVDAGTYLRTYAYALKKSGLLPERELPWHPSDVNLTPPPSAFRKAWGRRTVRGYYSITQRGDERGRAVRAAIGAGHPVVFGTQVNAAFCRHQGDEVIEKPRGELLGGHALCCIGFKYDWTRRSYLYRIQNSWGSSYRASGCFLMTEEFLQWHHTQDLWVISLHY